MVYIRSRLLVTFRASLHLPTRDLRKAFCDAHGIAVEAWSPLSGQNASALSDPKVKDGFSRWIQYIQWILVLMEDDGR